MVIGDETEQSKRRQKAISVFHLVASFASSEKKTWHGFLWEIKVRSTACKLRWKFASGCWGAPWEGYLGTQRKMKALEYWENEMDVTEGYTRRQHECRLPTPPQSKHIEPHHLEVFVLWSWTENFPNSQHFPGHFTSCQCSPGSLMLLLPVQAISRMCICFNLKLVFKPLNDFRSTEWTMKLCVKFHFSYSKLTGRKSEGGYSRHRNCWIPVIVWWKLCNVGRRLKKRVWITCSDSGDTPEQVWFLSLLTVWAEQSSETTSNLEY